MQNNLSVVVLVHNDENTIVDCLESVKFADEIVVVDDNSTDRTKELCMQFTKNIKSHSLNGNFSSQRNYAFNYAHCNWILFVDSDEVVSDKLKNEILHAIKSTSVNGFYLKRIDYMWGKPILHGEAGSVKLLRLARRGTGKWHGKIHERWQVYGAKEELGSALVHIPHQSVREFIREVDEYSTLRVEELGDERQNVSPFSIIFYPLGKFLVNYFVKQGYRDEVPGLIYAIIMSFHSFLVRAKLYQKTHK